MNIVFFGTGEFSATVAEAILNSQHKIVAVVTQPDKANSRGGKVKFNALKQFALNNNIPLHQFEKLNVQGEEVLRSYNADFFVTASYGQIIKQNILALPKYCIANVHGSLLPKYRGPAPIQWSIINGEKVTGVTIMKTELGLDCGEMYLKKELEITPDDTSDSVFDKLATLGGVAIVEFLDNAEYYMANGVKQDENEMTYFPMLTKEMAYIDFNTESQKLVNLIRGQYSCNTMYFTFNGARYKVGFAKVVDINQVASVNQRSINEIKAGEVLEASAKKGLIVATSDGAIEITKIQPEGKPMMDARAFCNGGKIKVGDMLNDCINLAKINWISFQDGGKNEIPTLNEKYYPMIKIENYDESFNWSFVLKNKQLINEYETIAEIRFLMDNAPHSLLKKDTKFALYEGNHLVAFGVVQ